MSCNYDYVLKQLHVSAYDGHRQVALGELTELTVSLRAHVV